MKYYRKQMCEEGLHKLGFCYRIAVKILKEALKMFRVIKEDDKKVLFEMLDEFYNSAAVLHPIPKSNYENTFRELMDSDKYLDGYIFETDGETAGYAIMSKSYSPEAGGRIMWIEEVYVRSAFRSRGIGRKFFEYLEDTFGEDVKRIRLEVEPDNRRAMSLYEGIGFKMLPYIQMVKDY